MKRVILILSVFAMLVGCNEKIMDSSSDAKDSEIPALSETEASEITEGVTEEAVTSWQSEYEKILSEYITSDDYTERSAFSLYDMDYDDIPELILSDDFSHAAMCRIYTYKNELIHLGEYGSNGIVGFYPETKNLINYYMGQGVENTTFYRLNGNKLDKLADFYDNSGALQSTVYKFNDKEVSETEYNSAYDEYCGDVIVKLGRDFPLYNDFIKLALNQYSDAETAYKELLLSLAENQSFNQYGGFSLYDITNDDIPELFVSQDFVTNSPCYIYSFDNGVISLGSNGNYGCVGYSEKLDLISSYTIKQGHEYQNFYKLSEYNTHELVIRFFNNEGAAETDEDLIYTINDEQVDFEEYQNKLEEYEDDASISLGLDYKLTAEEIEKAFSEYKNADKPMLTQETAAELLWSVIGTGEENQHLSYEKAEYHDGNKCYIFRYYNDFKDHRATLGWYAVDSETGECYNTNALTEWTIIETDPNVYEKQTYKEVLENIYYEMKFPEYDYNEENYSEPYSMEENEFAIYDIDNDGSNELILLFTETAVAGMTGYIYDHDSEGNIIEQLRCFPVMRFYDNGVIEEDTAHNQGPSGKFWPYTLYKYNGKSDTYMEIAYVEAMDKELVDKINQSVIDKGQEPLYDYPIEADISNSGFVYFLNPRSTNKDEPLDVTEYNAWHEQYIGDANLIDPPFVKLTEENIESVLQ